MKETIKKIFLLLFICAAAAGLSAQEISGDIDLSINIRALDDAIRSGRGIPAEGTPLILNGTVISRKVIDPEEETFAGEIGLANGEWAGTDSIKVSECIVILMGPRFSETIPARRSRGGNPKEIEMNSELLVYGYYLGTTETSRGLTAVIEASGIRRLN